MKWIPVEQEKPALNREILLLDDGGFVRKGEYVGLWPPGAKHWMYFEPPTPPDPFDVWWNKLRPDGNDPKCWRFVRTAWGEDIPTNIAVAKTIWTAACDAAKKH